MVVHGNDVRVFERRDDLCVAVEPTDEPRIGGEPFVDHLDRDVAFGVRLDRAEDHAGRPIAELLQEPIAAERLPTQLERGIRARVQVRAAG